MWRPVSRKYALLATAFMVAMLGAGSARAEFKFTQTFEYTGFDDQTKSNIQRAIDYWDSKIEGYKDGVNLNGITLNFKLYTGTGADAAASIIGTTSAGGSVYSTKSNVYIRNGAGWDLIAHELGHSIGFIGLLRQNNSYNDTDGFTGVNGLIGYFEEFNPATIPVPGNGGHWSDNADPQPISRYTGNRLADDIATHVVNSTYMSSLSYGALIDLGYKVAIPKDINDNYVLDTGYIFSSMTGARSMSKTSARIVTLGAAGDFTGGSTIAAGTVELRNAQALGTGDVALTGGMLDVNSVGLTGIDTLVLSSGSIIGTTGAIDAAAYQVQSGSISAILSGGGALTKDTTGKVILSGANTYTGATQVNAGELNVIGSLGNTAVTVGLGASLSGTGSFAGPVRFLNGSTLLEKPGEAMTINGPLTVDARTLIGFDGAPVVGTTYTVLNYNGSVSGLNNFATAFRGTVDVSTANVVKVTAASAVPLLWKGTTNNLWQTNDGRTNFARIPSGIVDNFFQADDVTFDDTALTKTVNLVGALRPNSITVNHNIGTYTFGDAGTIAGTTGITKSGAGTLVITGTDHTFTGKTVINGGIVEIAADASLGTAPSAVVSDQLTLAGGTLRVANSMTLATNRGITVNSASFFDTNGHDVTYSGALTGSGNFTKIGDGKLDMLAGSGPITGLVTVNDGVLHLHTPNIGGLNNDIGATKLDVGPDGTLVVGTVNKYPGSINRTVTVHGNGAGATTGFQIEAGRNFYVMGAVTLTDAPTTIRAYGVGNASISSYFMGGSNLNVLASASGSVIDTSVDFGGTPKQLSGTGGFVLNLTAGANTATGDLRIDGVIRSGTALRTTGTGTVNFTAVSPGATATSFDLRNTSSVMFTGASSLGGGTNTGAITMASGAKFAWKSSVASQTLSGVISGSGLLEKAGTGDLVLTGANTYTGATTVSGGGLYIDGDQTAANGLTTLNNGGTLGGIGTIGGSVVVNNGGTFAPGSSTGDPGTLTLKSALTLASGAKLAYSFGEANVPGGPLNDLAIVNGDLTLDGTLDVALTPGGSFGPGVYRIMNYTGALTNNGLDVGSAPVPTSDLSIQTAIANQVNLIQRAVGMPMNFWDGAAGPKDNATINGGDGVWQSNAGNNNWADSSGITNGAYSDGEFAIFQAAPGIVTVDNSLGAVSSAGMQFVESGYTITGAPLTLVGTNAVLRVGDGTAASSAYTATISANLQGTANVEKTDLGKLVLTGANTYSGATTITKGVLNIQNNAALGTSAGATTVANGATLEMQGGITVTDEALTLNGNGAGNAGALRNISGNNTWTGAITLGSDTRINSAASSVLTLSGDITGAGKNLLIAGNGATVISGAIDTTTGGLTKIGNGIATVAGVNTYTGATLVNVGTLQAGMAGQAFGSNSAVTLANVAGVTLDLNNFSQSIGSLAGGGTTGGIVTLGTATLTTGGNNQSAAFAGVISGAGGLTKSGSGTQTLTGNNTYTGATTVSAGILEVNGAIASVQTNVASGAKLAGLGTIQGNVMVADGGMLAPGANSATPGALTINGNLALNNASILEFSLGAPDVVGGSLNDLITVNGNLALDGVLNVTQPPGGSFGPGIYRLINYSGALTDGTLDIGTSPAAAVDLSIQTSIANQVNLVQQAAASSPLSFWDGSGPKNDSAISGGSGIWQNSTGNDNWTDQDGSPNVEYTDGTFAVFQGAPGLVEVDDSLGAVTATGMQFAANGYNLEGTQLTLTGVQAVIRVGDGSAAGAGYTATIDTSLGGGSQLVKTDLGTLVLNGTNTYTGGTAINGGTLAIAADENLGDAAGGLSFDGGTLRAETNLTTSRTMVLNAGGGTINTNSADSSFNGLLTGAGALTIDGTGSATLGGANDYTGGTTVKGGATAAVNSDSSLGAAAGDLTLNNGTVRTLAGFTSTREVVLAAGGGTVDTNGFDVVQSGVISGPGALTKNGDGMLTLTADNTFGGTTTINAGSLQIGNGGTTGSLAGNVANHSELIFNRSGTITYDGSISGNGIVSQVGSGTTVLNGTSTMGILNLGAGTLALGPAASVTTGAFTQLAGATLSLDVSSPGTPLKITGDALFGGSISLANANTLKGQVNRVLLDVGGTTNGSFSSPDGTVLGENASYRYVLSYMMGDGNDIGIMAIPLVNLAAMMQGLENPMRVGQDSAVGIMHDMEDRVALHRRIGFFEDRASGGGSVAATLERSAGLPDGISASQFDFSGDTARRGMAYTNASYGQFDYDGGLSGATQRYKVGYDALVRRDAWVGADFSYSTTDWHQGTSSGELNAYRLSLYGSWEMTKRWFLDAGLGGGLLDLSTERSGGQKGDFSGWDSYAFTRIAWRAIDQQQNGVITRLEPFVGLRGVHTALNGYTEEGPNPLAVGGQTSNLGQAFAGVTWSQWFDAPQLFGKDAAWGYHLRLQGFVGAGNQTQNASVLMIGSGSSPTSVSAADFDRWGGHLTLGTDYRFGDWTISADVSASESENTEAWQTKLNVSWWW